MGTPTKGQGWLLILAIAGVMMSGVVAFALYGVYATRALRTTPASPGVEHRRITAAEVPAWVPAYPGSAPQGNYASTNSYEASGGFNFKSADPPPKIAGHYKAALKNEGFSVSAAGDMMISADAPTNRRSIIVTLVPSGGETVVRVVYKEAR